MSRRWLTVCSVALVVVMVACSASDAQQRQRRGRGGFGGFGGFGGGGALALLGMEEVRKELELDEDQTKEVRKLQEGIRPDRSQFARLRDLSREEQREAFQKIREESEKKQANAEKKLVEILLPHQAKRLEELRIQRLGTRAFTDKKVVAALKITGEQTKKIEEISREAFASFRGGAGRPGRPGEGDQNARRRRRPGGDQGARGERRRPGGDQGARRGRGGQGRGGDFLARMREIQKQTTDKIMAVLTSDQKKKFEELKGKTFDFPQPRFSGRGGRGGRGGAAGRPGRPGRPGGDDNNRRRRPGNDG